MMTKILSALYQTDKNIRKVLQNILNEQNNVSRVQQASISAVMNGGKRLRPFLVMETAKLFDINDPRILRIASAIECVHCYSLVHDDLPSMDNDDMRRGQPTLHKKYDEATAILAGDGLLTLAFEILADEKTHKDSDVRAKLCLELAKASGLNGMVGGQMCDLQAESSNDLLNMQEIKNIQNLKTGKLIQCAVKIGAIVGGANSKQMQCLENYASNIGLAFQVSDDLLDALGDEILMGKSVRKDDVKNKATFVSLLGADKAQELARDLIKSAKSELEMFDEKNQTLKQLADFIIDRDS
ncbi:MAG: polyprenyl synthetase family protein [Alphaproteobacteria bacterium]|nr:polyprenyl synthetase family protein [Alphaproteobacteria bacterium]